MFVQMLRMIDALGEPCPMPRHCVGKDTVSAPTPLGHCNPWMTNMLGRGAFRHIRARPAFHRNTPSEPPWGPVIENAVQLLTFFSKSRFS